MRIFYYVGCLIAVFSLSHCGRGTSATNTDDVAIHERTMLKLGVNVNGFALDSAPLLETISYTISMEQCVSGLTGAASNSTPYLQAYLQDHGCLAKLMSIQFRNLTWTVAPKQGFFTYKAGEKATFIANNDGITQLQVTVVSQLNDPITTADTVSYSFIEKQPGNDSVVTNFKISVKTSVLGQISPSFLLRKGDLIGITPTGAGRFSFLFECDVPIMMEGKTPYCHDNRLDQTRYILLKDPLDHQLTFDEVNALFTNGTGILPVAIPDDFLAAAAPYPNGGFITKQGSTSLLGPDRLNQTPNLILIVGNLGSFQLFKIKLDLY